MNLSEDEEDEVFIRGASACAFDWNVSFHGWRAHPFLWFCCEYYFSTFFSQPAFFLSGYSDVLQLKETNFTRLCSTKSMTTVNDSFPGPVIRRVQSRGIGHWLGRSWGTSISVSRIGIGWYIKNFNLRAQNNFKKLWKLLKN